jgi:hypothetical protein
MNQLTTQKTKDEQDNIYSNVNMDGILKNYKGKDKQPNETWATSIDNSPRIKE